MATPVFFARDLINKHLESLGNFYNQPSAPIYSTLGGAALGMNAGAAASIIDGMQGDRQSLADNAMLDTVVNGVGYGGLAAGVGALTTPGLVKQAVLDGRLRRGDYNRQVSGTNVHSIKPVGSVRHGQHLAQSRRSLGNVAGRRALMGAGVTAAGAGLLNLINAFGQRNPDVYY